MPAPHARGSGARYAPACRRRIGGMPRGSRMARGMPWTERGRRWSVGRRPEGRRPAPRGRSREREQPSRFAVRAYAVWGWITACARGRGRTNESVRALKAPCDDAIRRCSLLRSTCYVDARGLCPSTGTRVRCSPTDSRRVSWRGPFQRCNRHGNVVSSGFEVDRPSTEFERREMRFSQWQIAVDFHGCG